MKRFMDESHRLSLIISTSIILVVLAISLGLMSYFMAEETSRVASATADQLVAALIDPLYNVDDAQAARIGKALLSSGPIAGLVIRSTATGLVMDERGERASAWIKPQSRDIEFQGLELGSVTLYFSDRALAEIILGFVAIMLALLAAVLAANFLAHRLLSRKRVERLLAGLTSGIAEIAAGRYDRRIEATGYSDIDAIVGSMNDMAGKVRDKSEELVAANSLLEKRVSERTAELEKSLDEQRLLQDRLIRSEKLTALGQVSAGIAHELNSPLAAILSANRTIAEYLDEAVPGILPLVESMDRSERSLYGEITRLGLRENRTLGAALPSRKLGRGLRAALEEAGVEDAEELAAKLVDLGLQESVPELASLLSTRRVLEVVSAAGEAAIARRMARVIDESAQRAAGVVAAFRSFLSPGSGGEDQVVDAAEDLEKVLSMMRVALDRGVEVRASLDPAPIRGSPEKLTLVWLNLVRNAVQAMGYRGILELRTERRGDAVVVSVIDDGPGIPDELRGRIFEPFFTTKIKGEGMGIGLDICKRIVESLRGSISFESRPGRTAFIVSLPAAPEAVDAPAAAD